MAFNAIHKEPILDVIRDELPVLLPSAELLLSMNPTHTVYHNNRTKDTVVHSMNQGTPQGGSASSALFNLGQSRSICEESRPSIYALDSLLQRQLQVKMSYLALASSALMTSAASLWRPN